MIKIEEDRELNEGFKRQEESERCGRRQIDRKVRTRELRMKEIKPHDERMRVIRRIELERSEGKAEEDD
jgi:hypothetical protein